MPDPTLPPGPWCWREFTRGCFGLYTAHSGAVCVLVPGTGDEAGLSPVGILMVRDADGQLVPIDAEHPVARALAATPALLAACEVLLDDVLAYLRRGGALTEREALHVRQMQDAVALARPQPSPAKEAP